jgi:NADH-quinone oxidoreductase subunit C
MSIILHSAPKYASNDGVAKALSKSLGKAVIDTLDAHGELTLNIKREAIADVMVALRDGHDYQQMMEIAGADYPARAERFDVCYHLLSVTKNHRLRLRVTTDEATPVPSITHIWPNAGWLEREVYDMYGVIFAGNPDLRRILTDYGFKGHPFRKDFPLTGYVEMRYSETQKRVVYEPVQLAQDFRSFDFMSPWEGAAHDMQDAMLPGDEKAIVKAAAAPSKAAAKPVAAPKTKAPAKPKSAAKPKGKSS